MTPVHPWPSMGGMRQITFRSACRPRYKLPK
jgi:hypothetical protein